MTTWIHCNLCYLTYSQDRQFYLQNCSHILCAKCLKKSVIANGNKCKMCKRPVQYKKIGPEMDPKIRECFDLRQNQKIEGVINGLKLAELQVKHMTDPSMLKKMETKTKELQELRKKLREKNEAMRKYLAQAKKKESFSLRQQAMEKSMLSTERESFISSQATVKKEPLLKIGSASSFKSGSSSYGSSPGIPHQQQQQQQKKSDFVRASSLHKSSDHAPPGGRPIKRHPQITRLSKISALASEFSRQRIDN